MSTAKSSETGTPRLCTAWDPFAVSWWTALGKAPFLPFASERQRPIAYRKIGLISRPFIGRIFLSGNPTHPEQFQQKRTIGKAAPNHLFFLWTNYPQFLFAMLEVVLICQTVQQTPYEHQCRYHRLVALETSSYSVQQLFRSDAHLFTPSNLP